MYTSDMIIGLLHIIGNFFVCIFVFCKKGNSFAKHEKYLQLSRICNLLTHSLD